MAKEKEKENGRSDFGVTVVGYYQKDGVIEPVTDATVAGRILARRLQEESLNIAFRQELS